MTRGFSRRAAGIPIVGACRFVAAGLLRRAPAEPRGVPLSLAVQLHRGRERRHRDRMGARRVPDHRADRVVVVCGDDRRPRRMPWTGVRCARRWGGRHHIPLRDDAGLPVLGVVLPGHADAAGAAAIGRVRSALISTPRRPTSEDHVVARRLGAVWSRWSPESTTARTAATTPAGSWTAAR